MIIKKSNRGGERFILFTGHVTVPYWGGEDST